MKDKLGRLWAPWRLEYIQSAAEGSLSGCFLCDAVAAADDREHLVLHRSRLSFLVMNLYPYNNGHLLAAPRRHLAGLDDLTAAELSDLGEVVRKAVRWLDLAYRPHGYNIGLNLGRVAGAGLPGHLHYHIVPRWDGDTNFLPVLGVAKVVSEGLKSSYDRLIKVINEVGDGNFGENRNKARRYNRRSR